jgi:hypothetical protein
MAGVAQKKFVAAVLGVHAKCAARAGPRVKLPTNTSEIAVEEQWIMARVPQKRSAASPDICECKEFSEILLPPNGSQK